MYEQVGFFKGLGMWLVRWAIILAVLAIVVLGIYKCNQPGNESETGVAEQGQTNEPNRVEGWNELINRLKGNG